MAGTKYKVSWVVQSIEVDTPSRGATSVTLEVAGLAEAVTLARDVYYRARERNQEIYLTVDAAGVPIRNGKHFIEWVSTQEEVTA